LIVAAAIVAFVVLLLAGGPFYQSFDEAKYLGLGHNLFAGRGYTTVFGGTFTTHSPAWPVILVAPQAWFGLDPLSVGRVLNGLSAAGLIALCAALAWRIRPAAGALAAVAVIGVVYMHDLSRTARLDVPGAFVSVLAVVVGLIAMRRGSVRWAMASGALFALSFLIKETSLVYVAVPALAAVLWRPPLRLVARMSAWIGLVTAIGVSWWFVFVASATGLVYRTPLPAWTLIPIAAFLAAAIGVGLAADRIARLPWLSQRAVALGTFGERHPTLAGGVPWLLPVVWALLVLLVLSRSPELGRAGLFDRSQWREWVARWLPIMRFALLFGLVGSLAMLAGAAGELRRRRREPSAGPHDEGPIGPALLVANIVGLPLIAFVIATGEPPRNDFAPLVFLIAYAAGGWLLVADWLVRNRASLGAVLAAGLVGAVVGGCLSALVGRPSFRVATVAGTLLLGGAFAVAWLRPRVGDLVASRVGRSALVGALVLSLVVSSGTLALHVSRHPGTGADSSRAQAVDTVTAWIRANIALGTPLAFGSLLGNESAIALEGYPVTKLAAIRATFDVAAPLGLSGGDAARQDDWLSIDPHPRKETDFLVFSARSVAAILRVHRIAYWFYTTGESTAAPTILGAMTPADGFEEVMHWQWRNGDQTSAFRVDLAGVQFAGQPVRIAPAAVTRLAGLLEQRGTAARAPARALLDALEVWPPSSSASAALSTLRVLAGPGG
jgi:4-amino-4-deoxy-L-arabinose transferase-like glycosyltransferase